MSDYEIGTTQGSLPEPLTLSEAADELIKTMDSLAEELPGIHEAVANRLGVKRVHRATNYFQQEATSHRLMNEWVASIELPRFTVAWATEQLAGHEGNVISKVKHLTTASRNDHGRVRLSLQEARDLLRLTDAEASERWKSVGILVNGTVYPTPVDWPHLFAPGHTLHRHDTDAAGNCRNPACMFNSDNEHDGTTMTPLVCPECDSSDQHQRKSVTEDNGGHSTLAPCGNPWHLPPIVRRGPSAMELSVVPTPEELAQAEPLREAIHKAYEAMLPVLDSPKEPSSE